MHVTCWLTTSKVQDFVFAIIYRYWITAHAIYQIFECWVNLEYKIELSDENDMNHNLKSAALCSINSYALIMG